MFISLTNLLVPETLKAIREALDAPNIFHDGSVTAAGRAKAAKRNLQLTESTPAGRGVIVKIKQDLLAHPVFVAAAQPKSFARVLISRYESGMEYGEHVDAAIIDGTRTDLSFTLFLSGPEEYEGGSLVIDTPGSVEQIKLPAGAMVLYPSTMLHRVEPVASGTRLAAVGWVRSFIRSTERRSILFELDTLLADLKDKSGDGQNLNRLANIRNNLLRMWVED